MRKYPKVLGCIFVLIFFLLSSCSVIISDNSISNNQGTDSTVPAVPGEENQDNTTTPENPNTTKPDSNTPETSDQDKNEPQNPEEGGETIPPKEEDKKPDDNVNPNNDSYVEPDSTAGIKPYPNDITAENVKKVRPVFQFDNNFMYLMVRFKGLSEEKRLWKQESESGAGVYPRGFVLGYTDIHTNQYAETHLDGYDNNLDPLPGIGYDKDFGFTDGTGAYLLSNFFYGNEHLRTRIYGNEDIKFQFRNFVIWDKLDDGIGLMGHPAFVRLNESHPLTVIVPMKDYNPEIHKNIAYITVYFELDKGTADNPYPYQAVLDGFEPK